MTIEAGQRHGNLVTVAKVQRPEGPRWQCRCDCGKESFVRTRYLTSGRTRSCGCAVAQHQRLRKLTPDQVVAIRASTAPLRQVGRTFNIHPSLVSRIRRGIRSAHVTGTTA